MKQAARGRDERQGMEDGGSSEHQGTTQQRLKVLIVEDSLVEQVRLKTMVSKNGYEVICANNGREALSLLESEQVQLVVSDWRMPELTGLDLCRELRNEPQYGLPYFILLTGFNTQSDLVAGMDAGADDFITKPVSNEELRVRLQAGARIIKLRGELESQNQQLEATLQREAAIHLHIQRDLDAAARMQRQLLPDGQSPFAQLEIGTLFQPALTVAGDGFGYFKLDDDHLAFYHLDVAGHGIASAMLSFTLSRYLSPDLAEELMREAITSDEEQLDELAAHIAPPHRVVSMLNQRFQENQECNHYFTMIYGVLNVSSGYGDLCQAGHPHPLIVNNNGAIRKLGAGGFPVGMFDHAEYESTPFQLNKGERLYLFSDGITDTTNMNGEPLGAERYEHILSRSSKFSLNKTIEAINATLHHWNGDQDFDDDISLLVLGHCADA
jgi:sigma-B regulation protein RsbU (phosphoserine phosphatase)